MGGVGGATLCQLSLPPPPSMLTGAAALGHRNFPKSAATPPTLSYAVAEIGKVIRLGRCELKAQEAAYQWGHSKRKGTSKRENQKTHVSVRNAQTKYSSCGSPFNRRNSQKTPCRII